MTEFNRIPYYNASGEAVPSHGFLQLSGAQIATAAGDYVPQAVKPGSGSGPYVIDDGNGTTSSGDSQYGNCFLANDRCVWLACVDSLANWQEIGPVSGSFLASSSGKGYYYAGYADSGNGRVLAIQHLETERTEWAKITTPLTVGEFASPADVLIDIWETDPITGVLERTADTLLQDLPAKIYTGCPVTSSSSSSSSSSQTPCRVVYRSGFWQVTNIYKCIDVVTAVSCSGGGLSVTYGKAMR